MNEVVDILKNGTWVAFSGFGVYLAYKLAMTTVITIGVIKVAKQIIEMLSLAKETNQRLFQLAAAAGLRWPLSPEEWEQLLNRVKPKA